MNFKYFSFALAAAAVAVGSLGLHHKSIGNNKVFGVITVINKTSSPVYIAPYYVPKFAPVVARAADPIEILPGKTVYVDRPKFKLGYDRFLFVSENKSEVQKSITHDSFIKRKPKNIGTLAGARLYIAKMGRHVRAYTAFEWHLWKPLVISKKAGDTIGSAVGSATKIVGAGYDKVKSTISKAFEESVRFRLSDFWNTPHIDMIARVRVGDDLSVGEKKALAQRKLRISRKLEQKFGSVSYVPKITFLFSGGGYRSMFLSLGFLAAAQEIGLLDMATWMGMVSGGSWAVGSLLTHALYEKKDMSIASFNEKFAQLLDNKKIAPSNTKEIKEINNLLMVQAIEHQAFTSINLFGALIANRLFSFLPTNERQQVHLSGQANMIERGDWPIPIYTAVHYDPNVPAERYGWVETTPWEIGGSYLHCYAPIWATGRQFKHGISVDNRIEKSMGYMLGLYGSAFAADAASLYDTFKESLWKVVQSLVESVILEQMSERRFWWGQLYNFSKGVKVSPLRNYEYLDLIDAGFACNIAYPPCSGERPERKPDMFIIVDNSTTVQNGLALSLAEDYARRHDLKFPKIDYQGIGERAISVFKEEDESIPIVIYMPRVMDASYKPKLKEKKFKSFEKWLDGFDINSCVKSGYCEITNLKYSYEQAMRLMKLAEFNLLASKEIIFANIKQLVQRSWYKGLIKSFFFG